VRLKNAVWESLYLVRWYAQEHVLLCLIPAFFIAGAIAVFVSQASVMKYLGAKANKVLAYGVASVSGTILAVCSCTVLPLFAGIYRMGAGLGPACAFLYSGPAINVLAIFLTARVLGFSLGLARAVGAVGDHVDHCFGEPGIGGVGRRHQELPGQEERVRGSAGRLVVGAAGKRRQGEDQREGPQQAEAATGDRASPRDPRQLIISRQALKPRQPYPRTRVRATVLVTVSTSGNSGEETQKRGLEFRESPVTKCVENSDCSSINPAVAPNVPRIVADHRPMTP